MSLLITPDQTFDVTVYAAPDPKNPAIIYAALTEEALRAGYPTVTDVKSYDFKFRMPTYRDNVDAIDASTKLGEDGRFSFRTSLLRFYRLTSLLKKWSLVEDDGTEVPLNLHTIGQLPPNVAIVLGNEMEEILGVL